MIFSIRNSLIFFSVISVFLFGFILPVPGFDFYLVYLLFPVAVGAYVLLSGSFRIPKSFFIFFILTTIISLIVIVWTKSPVSYPLKQLVGLLFSGLGYYSVFLLAKFDIRKLHRLYLHLAVIISLIALLQQIFYQVGIPFLYDFSYFISRFRIEPTSFGLLRAASILPEPAAFTYVMTPAIFYSFYSIFVKDFKVLSKLSNILIISAFILSFSSLGFLSIALCITIILWYKSKKIFVVGLLALSLGFIFLFLVNPLFYIRVSDTANFVTGTAELHKVNLSTYALFSNFYVVKESFLNNPLWGTGLGTHQLNYYKFIFDVVPSDFFYLGLNAEDANSMALRLISETGIIGLSLFLIFVLRKRINRQGLGSYLFVVNQGVFVLIMLKLLRSGNYFANGFIFFLLLYYFSYEFYKNGQVSEKSS